MIELATAHWRRFALALILFVMGAAIAEIPRHTDGQKVTSADVAAAIRNSPNASAWLKQNADSVGALAMFESSGELGVYNGSCCYGILQMNKQNIRDYAGGASPEEFRTWDLQRQIDAWSQLTSNMLATENPRRLIASGAFDGRQVDGSLVLSCVQLGVGNCGRMINSGSCGGFADSNGTTICAMSDAIRNGSSLPTSNVGVNPGSGVGGANWPIWTSPGAGMSVAEAVSTGFESGSGVSMARLRSVLMMLLAALAFLVVGSAMLGVWQNYSKGVLSSADLIYHMQRGIIIVGLIFIVMSLF